jgi:gamma-glutamyltranspeptidase/glutathione hydrolase
MPFTLYSSCRARPSLRGVPRPVLRVHARAFAALLLGVCLVTIPGRAWNGAPGSSPQAAPQKPERDFAAGEMDQPNWPASSVRSRGAMVVSDEQLANEAGLDMLRQGGNAVDAAVAVAFALAVVEPQAGNIGGGGFFLLRMADGRASFLDYRETAPAAARREMFLREDGSFDSEAATIGYRAAGIPGTVAGLELALRIWGTLPLERVMAPAIRLASRGFAVSEKLARALEAARGRLERYPRSKKIFLNNGRLYRPGEILRQRELARTLRRVAEGGAGEFYSGRTARAMVKDIRSHGGLITQTDLDNYRPKVREPLRARLRQNGADWEILSAPPPSSGGVALVGALEILAPVELARWDPSQSGSRAAAQSFHWIAEALRRVFADRATYLADPDFIHVPVRGLIDPRYADERRATIDPERASLSETVRAGNPLPYDAPLPAGQHIALRDADAVRQWMEHESAREGHTTHFSVVDAAGNAVSNTFTLNDSFGAAVTVAGGFLLNDTMDDFTAEPGAPNKLFNLLQSEENTIAPGKRPVSSMTPAILLRDGRLSFLTGSPGGPRIISAALLSVLYWMRFGADPQMGINAPRIHHQWMPDELYVEETVPAEVVRELEARGHRVRLRSWIGQVQAIGIDPATGERLGAADARRNGAAAGLP